MSKWQPIVDELNSDPTTYSGLTDTAAAAAIQAKTEVVDAGEIDPFEIDNVVPPAERAALRTAAPELYDKWQAILAGGKTIDVKSAAMQGMLAVTGPGDKAIFAQPTIDAINALGTKTVSIAAAWRVPVNVRAVQKARKEMA